MCMNKTDIILTVAEDLDIPKSEASKAVDAVLGAIIEGIEISDKVQFNGFGSFKLVTRAERNGHNPITGEFIIIPERKTIKFKPSQVLLEEFN